MSTPGQDSPHQHGGDSIERSLGEATEPEVAADEAMSLQGAASPHRLSVWDRLMLPLSHIPLWCAATAGVVIATVGSVVLAPVMHTYGISLALCIGTGLPLETLNAKANLSRDL